jgi:hypothetical protein
VQDSSVKITKSKFKKDKLYPKVTAAVHKILKGGRVVTPVGVMMEMGYLRKDQFEDWRFGRVSCLERVISCNLSKAQRVLMILKYHSQECGLKQSSTIYKKWGEGRKQLLRFSVSGSPFMETLYATHYVAGVAKKRTSDQDGRPPSH